MSFFSNLFIEVEKTGKYWNFLNKATKPTKCKDIEPLKRELLEKNTWWQRKSMQNKHTLCNNRKQFNQQSSESWGWWISSWNTTMPATTTGQIKNSTWLCAGKGKQLTMKLGCPLVLLLVARSALLYLKYVDLGTKFRRSAIWVGVSAVWSGRLGLLLSLCNMACTVSSIGTTHARKNERTWQGYVNRTHSESHSFRTC